MTVPIRIPDQRTDALRFANEIRSKRAVLKAELKAGTAYLGPVLISPASWLRTMRIHSLLLATPRIGETKAVRILEACRLPRTIQVRHTTAEGRRKLLRLIEERYPKVELGEWLFEASEARI